MNKGVRTDIDRRLLFFSTELGARDARPKFSVVRKVADRQFVITKEGFQGRTLVFCRDHRWRIFRNAQWE